MSIAGLKLDDGTNPPLHPTNFFPIRTLVPKHSDEGGGAWLVAHRAEQRKHFKAILCTKPKSYAEIRQERMEREKRERRAAESKERARGVLPEPIFHESQDILDGFFLMKHCCVEDPADLCSVNIAGLYLTAARSQDFEIFDCVAYVNAAENLLPFEAFSQFPIIRELEIPLNGLRGLRFGLDDFPHLEVLDMSYNNLSGKDVLSLGILPNLKVLHLTGNQLRSLPIEMSQPFALDPEENSKRPSHCVRFEKLEILFLDDNYLTDLTTFATLAGLKKLKRLNLDKNDIYCVPHLRAVGALITSEMPSLANSPQKEQKSNEQSSEDIIASALKDLDLNELGGISEISEEEGVDVERASSVASSLGSSSQEAPPPPPFAELEYLSIAYNKIEEEESVLAVAAWPMLRELVLHDNPLTTRTSGDPPLLRRYLVRRLGIHLTRLRPGKLLKPNVHIPLKRGRKVSSHVPKIPKQPIVLSLEAPPPQPLSLPSSQDTTPTGSPPLTPATPAGRPRSQPLPPISPPAPDQTLDDDDGASSRTQTYSEQDFDEEEEEEADLPGDDQQPEAADKDQFFLTQVDGQEEEEPSKLEAELPKQKASKAPRQKPAARRKGAAKRRDSAADSLSMHDKYKGYELLLDTWHDPEDVIPKDIRGSTRALEFALKHPTTYKTEVNLERLQKPFIPYEKTRVNYGPTPKTKAQKVNEVLDMVKNNKIGVDHSLAAVMADKEKLKRHPEAIKLLGEIQEKYRAVRRVSLKEQQEASRAMQATLHSARATSTRLKATMAAAKSAAPPPNPSPDT